MLAAAAVIVAGLMVAAVLLFATSGGGPTKNRPFSAGLASALRSNIRDQGPQLIADPFGGNRSFYLALEDHKIVALWDIVPGTKDCVVKLKQESTRYVDCHGTRVMTTDLDRYEVDIPVAGSSKGLLLVDLRKRLPAPG